MTSCFFVSDLHGRAERYRKLLRAVEAERPQALFIGGDILPHMRGGNSADEYLEENVVRPLGMLKRTLGSHYPRVFLILGNDDERAVERRILAAAEKELLSYMHMRAETFELWRIFGYAYVPPSPFLLKDWERWDVDRTLPAGNVSPEEGLRTADAPPEEAAAPTIAEGLERLAGPEDLSNAVFLFHAPPHGGPLDQIGARARGMAGAERGLHVGSRAIRRFIESRRPLLTLHGHIHESARVSGSWRETIGRTVALSAAHDGPELALIRFDLDSPGKAERELA